MKLLFHLAFRNLMRHRVRTLLTATSLVCGYILLSLSMSVTDGSYSNLIETFTRAQTAHVQIHHLEYLERPSLYKRIPFPSNYEDQLKNYQWAPRVIGPALSYANNKSHPVSVRGVDFPRETQVTNLSEQVKQGQLPSNSPNPDGYFEVAVGANVAKILKLNIGDELVLISQGADGSVANDAYIVSAVVGDNDSLFRQNVYLPLTAAQQFYSMSDSVHEIAILTDSYHSAEKTKYQLQEHFVHLSVASWQEIEKEFYKTMTIDKEANAVPSFIVILVICIGVLNTILMSTLERTKEYGVLKALGTRPLFLFLSIMIETFILCIGSMLVGLLCSYPILYWFATVGFEYEEPFDVAGMKFSHLMGEISVQTLGLPALYLLIAVSLFSLYPAIRSANLTPLDALRSR